jgi:hypothetical protein
MLGNYFMESEQQQRSPADEGAAIFLFYFFGAACYSWLNF